MADPSTETGRPSVNDYPCPACRAAVGESCTVHIAGEDTTGWSHDARILAPVHEAIAALRDPPAEDGAR